MLDWIRQKISPAALPHVARLAGGEVRFAVPPHETLLQAALESGLDLLHHCTVGTCGTCRCRLLQGKVRPILDFSCTLSANELEAGYILACQTLLKTDIVIEAALDEAPAHSLEDYTGTVTSLCGARTAQDLSAKERLDALAHAWPTTFNFITILSLEPTGSAWPGRRGLVSDYLSDHEVGFALGKSHAYGCGPPGMFDAALVSLATAGVPAEHVHYDKLLDSRQLEASVLTEVCEPATGRKR